MPDLRLIMIDYQLFVKRYEWIGIIGKGEDPIMELNCVNWLAQDLQEGEEKLMQIYCNLGQEVFQVKLDQVNKTYYDHYTPHQTQLECVTCMKKEDNKYDLILLYQSTLHDNHSLMFLEQELDNRRRLGQQGLQVQQVKNLVSVLCEQLYIGSRMTREYLCLNPANLLFQNKDTRQIIVSNLNLKSRMNNQYYNKQDQVLSQQIHNRTGEQLVRHHLFTIGLTGLMCLTLCNVNALFVDGVPSQQAINQVIAKYRQIISNQQEDKSVEEQLNFISILEQFVQTQEMKRVSLDDLMEHIYFRGKLEGYGDYQGYFIMKKEKVPDGVGQLEVEGGWLYKGQLQEGKVEGRGIMCKGNRLVAGMWGQGQPIGQAIILDKGQTIYIGEVEAKQRQGQGVQLVLLSYQTFQQVFIQGTFHQDQYIDSKCKVIFRDGKTVYGQQLQDNSEDEDTNQTKNTQLLFITNQSQVQQNNSQLLNSLTNQSQLNNQSQNSQIK